MSLIYPMNWKEPATSDASALTVEQNAAIKKAVANTVDATKKPMDLKTALELAQKKIRDDYGKCVHDDYVLPLLRELEAERMPKVEIVELPVEK